MAKQIVVLSGQVASGKTELGDALQKRYGVECLKTWHLIRKLTGVGDERRTLQRAGARLDRRDGGAWLARALVREIDGRSENAIVLVDAVRIAGQVDAIRAAYGPKIVHVHLTAPPEVLRTRYARRRGKIRELPSYAAVQADPTERSVETLRDIADIVIDTGRCQRKDVLVRVATHLGLYGRSVDRLVDVLVGGEYGSEGKGHIASYLAPEYDVLIRVGGPNAGHSVYEEPKKYVFHHLPSGTRRCPNATLVLGPGAVIYAPGLLKELAECNVAAGRPPRRSRLAIDPQAMVIEKADRERESRRLVTGIGSTGQGVGVASSRKVLRNEARPAVRLAKDVAALKPFIGETLPILERAFADGQRVFLEGTQGTALSLHHGHYPYVTSRDTSVSGCLAETGIAPSRVRKIVMVSRTYPIRVENPHRGTSGPMGIEISWRVVSKRSGIPLPELLRAERTSTTNRMRRVGEFDWGLLRKAASLNGPTDIAITFADYISIRNRDARRFEQLTEETIRFVEEVERVGGAPVSLIATRFHSRGIIDRRAW